MILLSGIPLPDNKKEKVWIFDIWVSQKGDFCTWGAMKEADSGCGVAEHEHMGLVWGLTKPGLWSVQRYSVGKVWSIFLGKARTL